jgi:signal transduction histidine kinase
LLAIRENNFRVENQAQANRRSEDLRVLVMAPTGRDASLICQLLRREGIACSEFDSWSCLLSNLRVGAGSIIITEEALTPDIVGTLSQVIRDQPTWSDFPVLLLTLAGAVTLSSLRRRELQKPLGNVLLLERPIRPETLVSTVQSALRARKRQYQLRDQLQQQAEAENALRKSEKLAVAGRMAASIAHEINNPLESVTNLIYLSSTSERMADIKTFLATAEREIARVSAITAHTLRFHREPAGPVPVKVAELLDSVLTLFHSRLCQANIAVKKECGTVTPILGLEGELRQLFANLVGNALDAMGKGGTLTLRLRNVVSNNGHGAGVRVTVADTGHGIAPEMKPKLFEPFFTTKGQTGTGLGLWISSEIVQKHKGSIRVRSSVRPQRSGTVFSVFLPASS